jgi:ribosome modulation factor
MSDLRIKRAEALKQLDSDECVRGYLAGFSKETCPDDASFSFRHGWRNGASDKGYRPIDEIQRELARNVIDTKFLQSA